jgi:hypothetical protein
MPLDWFHLDAEGKAQAVLDDIEGLDERELQTLLAQWRELDEVGDRALASLQRMALDCIARKRGTPTSGDRARIRLQRRGVIE